MAAPRKYPQELRERAVRLPLESGRPHSHIANDLGVHYESLRHWVRQAEADQGKRSDRLTTQERERLKELERENRELRRANEILKAASVFFAQELDQPGRSDEVIDSHRERFGVEPICRVLEASDKTYYAKRCRPPSQRALGDVDLLEQINVVEDQNYGAYGSRRVWLALRRKGICVGRGRVERVMRQTASAALSRAASGSSRPSPIGRRQGRPISSSAASRRRRRTSSGSATSPT